MKNDFITNNEYYEDDNIITLKAATGKELNFIVIAGIYLDNKFYQIMQPVELLCGMEADEALVFLVTRNENGEVKFEIVLDDNIIDAVFVEYNKLLDEAGKTTEE